MSKKNEYEKAVDRVTEEDLEIIRENGNRLGEISSTEKASGILLEQASKFFKLGKDDLARLLRTISDEFKQEAKELRQKYDRDYK